MWFFGERTKERRQQQIARISYVAVIMVVGLCVFKYVPMYIWGDDILFDASQHVVTTVFALYVLWFFVDQNKTWRVPFFVCSTGIIVFMSIQRVLAYAHNEVGILLALGISVCAIGYVERKRLRGEFDF